MLKRANNCCENCFLQNKQTVYSVPFFIKEDGRYKRRMIWFRHENDAKREAGLYPVRPVKVVLTIAHLDHDETNHDVLLERLMALCQVCHLRYDAKEKYRRINEKWMKK